MEFSANNDTKQQKNAAKVSIKAWGTVCALSMQCSARNHLPRGVILFLEAYDFVLSHSALFYSLDKSSFHHQAGQSTQNYHSKEPLCITQHTPKGCPCHPLQPNAAGNPVT